MPYGIFAHTQKQFISNWKDAYEEIYPGLLPKQHPE